MCECQRLKNSAQRNGSGGLPHRHVPAQNAMKESLFENTGKNCSILFWFVMIVSLFLHIVKDGV